MKAVKFDRYGDASVLEVRDVERPEPEAGEVLVQVEAAGINPGEIAIREGAMHGQWPAEFPSGEGSDFAGVIESVGAGVTRFAVGDEVLGWVDTRSSHAEYVVAPEVHLAAKPEGLAWEVAGALYVGPMAGHAALAAVDPQPGDVIVVSAAAGGAGSTAAQLALQAGAKVIGLASEANHEWLRSRGIIPVAYGEGQEDRIRAVDGDGPDAFVDTFGGGYTDLAVGLGIDPARISTIIDFAAKERLGVQTTFSTSDVAELEKVAKLAASGDIEIPVQRTYPLEEVQGAYAELAKRRTRGKIVLVP